MSRSGSVQIATACIAQKGVVVADKNAIDPAASLQQVDDLRLVTELVVRQWAHETEQEDGGRDRIQLAGRGAAALLGRRGPSNGSSISGHESLKTPNTSVKTKTLPNSRPGLAKKVAAAWATPEGKRMLVSLPMRDLAAPFGVTSHTSFYYVPLFKEKILPLRKRGKNGQQAADWFEKNARSRP
jgi:hypothetical protein